MRKSEYAKQNIVTRDSTLTSNNYQFNHWSTKYKCSTFVFVLSEVFFSFDDIQNVKSFSLQYNSIHAYKYVSWNSLFIRKNTAIFGRHLIGYIQQIQCTGDALETRFVFWPFLEANHS